MRKSQWANYLTFICVIWGTVYTQVRPNINTQSWATMQIHMAWERNQTTLDKHVLHCEICVELPKQSVIKVMYEYVQEFLGETYKSCTLRVKQNTQSTIRPSKATKKVWQPQNICIHLMYWRREKTPLMIKTLSNCINFQRRALRTSYEVNGKFPFFL
jgi:hypothetical protein